MPLPPLRVLVVDASEYNRQKLPHILSGRDDIEVVGTAGESNVALGLVLRLRPDVITLGLEMPKMGSFTFLRRLMAYYPTPVIVISDPTNAEDFAAARELGALDCVAKPNRRFVSCDPAVRSEILSKVLRVREIRSTWTPKPVLPFSEGAAVEVPTPEEAEMMRQMPLQFRETWLLRTRERGWLWPRRSDPPPAAAAAPVLGPDPAPPSLVDAVDEPED